MHLVAKAETQVTATTVVAIEANVVPEVAATEVATAVDVVETAEAEAEIVVDAVVTEVVVDETATIVAHAPNDATPTPAATVVPDLIGQSDQNVQTEMVRAAEIVARGVQPVAMMEAVDDLARRVVDNSPN